ncbi:PREDICTED: uncharacterized protein LOC109327710 [Lupinus angustifolius]|uniref:uncharacterized protein LOC109327710 n=1 Tax=Lupinus angustifolius TaxID=3871 RepID=UPI00092F0902|nr:PREDICTED: uncharacterized protein LOC109327710 [Lupinus angustifolius]
MPIDVNLQRRGIHLAFVCSLCHAVEESSNYLFLECSFATALWHWLGNLIGSPLDSSSIQSLLMVCHSNWSPQLKLVVIASIINTISTIWHCKNHRRFVDTIVRFMQACDKIKMETALTENLYTLGSVKVNSDGATHGFLSHAEGCGIFRDNKGDMLGCFATYLNIQDSLYAELFTAIMAIQIANLRGWREVWLECDSSLVVDIVKGNKEPPWKLKNYWEHCKRIIPSLRLKVLHIFREGNSCADKLASFGLRSRTTSWWNLVPPFLLLNLIGIGIYCLIIGLKICNGFLCLALLVRNISVGALTPLP